MRKRGWRLALLGAATIACAGACNLVIRVPEDGSPQSDSGPSMSGTEAGPAEAGADATADAGADARPRDTGLADEAAQAPADAGTDADAAVLLPPKTIIALAGTAPVSLAVDGTNVYWTESNGGVFKVSRDADLGPVTTLKTPDDAGSSAGRIATDGTNVYWVDTAHQAIQYVSVLGGTPAPLVSPSNPGGVATDGAYVYWSDLSDRAVYRVAILDAGSIENMTGTYSAVDVYGIAVTASWLVWAELRGSPPMEFQSGYNWAVPLTPDAGVGGHFQWANEFNRNTWFIAADDLGIYATGLGDVPGTAGVGRTPFPPGQEGFPVASDTAPGAIAVSRTHDIFWVDQGSENAVRRVRYDADASPAATWLLPADTVASGAAPIAIGVDLDAVYFANAGMPYEIAKVRLADLPR
jgi:hypothetical protein